MPYSAFDGFAWYLAMEPVGVGRQCHFDHCWDIRSFVAWPKDWFGQYWHYHYPCSSGLAEVEIYGLADFIAT